MQISHFKCAHKIITGYGAVSQLKEQMLNLGVSRPFIITDQGVVQSGTLKTATEYLSDFNFGIYDKVKPEPEPDVVLECSRKFHAGDYDGIIAVGGGSVIDIAKCVSVYDEQFGPLENLFGENTISVRSVPLIVIPTTAGTGSEVTNIAILSDTSSQVKKGIVSDCLLPDVAIIAPEMTIYCPPSVTAASGVDALVHAMEAFLSNSSSPITDALAIKAMELIPVALPKAFSKPDNMQARENMATGSLLAGMAFGNAGVGAVHALAYPLGGRYHISHGVSNALLLPHVMEYNKVACLEKFTSIARAFGLPVDRQTHQYAADCVIDFLHRLCRDVNIPPSLQSLNIPQDAIPELASEAIKVERLLRNNPRKLTLAEIESIYQAAY
jgi:alcohol dehydrogenase class IV